MTTAGEGSRVRRDFALLRDARALDPSVRDGGPGRGYDPELLALAHLTNDCLDLLDPTSATLDRNGLAEAHAALFDRVRTAAPRSRTAAGLMLERVADATRRCTSPDRTARVYAWQLAVPGPLYRDVPRPPSQTTATSGFSVVGTLLLAQVPAPLARHAGGVAVPDGASRAALRAVDELTALGGGAALADLLPLAPHLG